MNLLDVWILFAVMLALAAVPSASVGLVVGRAAAFGFTQGAAVAAGIVTADLLFVLLAVLGMTAMAEVMGGFFLVIKWLAGAYLVWLGISLLRSGVNPDLAIPGPGNGGLITSFSAGMLLTLGDAKAIFFYASLFPAFVDLTALRAMDLVLISLITVVTVGGAKLLYAYSAGKIVAVIGAKMHRPAKTTAGLFMAGTGAWLICKG